MTIAFYIAAIIAVVATFMTITRLNAVHSLLYFVVSLLSMALIFLLLGAPFVAALQVIIYAGAIMVLFVFVVMVLSLGPRAIMEERQWLGHFSWVGPTVLTAVLMVEFIWIFWSGGETSVLVSPVTPKALGVLLLSRYLVAVELISMLLLVALVGAYHLAYHLGQRESAKTAERRK